MNGWSMTGLDITEEAREGAQANIDANPYLSDRLDLVIDIKHPGRPSEGEPIDNAHVESLSDFYVSQSIHPK